LISKRRKIKKKQNKKTDKNKKIIPKFDKNLQNIKALSFL